ncbi:MAG: glycerol-3-phosphate 1-O-acyltransferase PlsY [Candidatus Margulisiibacteriota bacterium]|jgi:glycerol-3-phosphate acyltransferase PlsY
MKLLFLIVLSYVIGSIPFSYLFPKLKGIDTRSSGTKNVGASNALLVSGPLAGVLSLIGDVLKGFIMIQLARYFGLSDIGIAFVGLVAVVGHDFSVFLRFNGGKGVATTGGVLLALDPIFTIMIVLFWILCMMLIRYFIPSTVLVLCLLPLIIWMSSWGWPYILMGIGFALLGLYAHRDDIRRFFAGEELTISQSLAKVFKKHRGVA